MRIGQIFMRFIQPSGVIPVDKRDDMIYYSVNSIVNDYGNVT